MGESLQVLGELTPTDGPHGPDGPRFDRNAVHQKLLDALIAGRNSDGGWGYYQGKASRIEPTCWALLALGLDNELKEAVTAAAAWLGQCQRPAGWLVEDTGWPINIGFNGLAAFTLLHHRALPVHDVRQRVVAALLKSKGLQAPPSENHRQDNSLQGWSWVDETFSWVEPTCWGLLALKKARGAGLGDAAGAARIAEAERLILDRTTRDGGWNYGNAWVLGKNLRPFAPTTALALLAVQDRSGEEPVARSLAALDRLWREEVSTTVLALSLVCLNVYGRPVDAVLDRLISYSDEALAFANHRSLAQAAFALSTIDRPHAFRL